MPRPAPLASALLAATAVATSAGIDAADEPDRKRLTATRIDEALVIDGRLDEPLWASAGMIDDFLQIRPRDGEPGTERTEVYVTYDKDNLYIGAKLWDKGEDGGITANILRQGSSLAEDDRLAIILDPSNTGRGGYRFEVNLNGVRNDMLYQGTQFSADWTVIWQTASARTDYGWSTEIAIPFKTLPFDRQADAWGFNVSRAIRRKGEEMIWVSRNRTWNPSIVGALEGLRDVDQGLGLDVVPSVGMTQRQSYGADPDKDTEFDPSLDVYYRVTPSLNASLTINTDFSATEVDDRQVNLTRFSLFFPEKRDFFLNDSDVFEFGRIGTNSYLTNARSVSRASQESGRPFFSRRLGLSALGTPVDIDYGGKLSGRIGRWRIGLLSIRQDEFDPPTGASVDASTVGVARIAADVLAESSVGMIATAGNPQSNSGNSLFGFDFLYANSRLPGNRVLEAEGWYQQSQSPDVGSARGDEDNAAWGVGVRMPNTQGLRFNFGLKELQANFRPALGFVSRQGVRDYSADVGWTKLVRGNLVQSVFAGVDGQRIDNIDGSTQTQIITLRPLEIESRARDTLRFFYGFNEEAIGVPFTIYTDINRRIVIPVGRYRYDDYGFDFLPGVQRRISGRISVRHGDFYTGERLALGGEVSWKQSRNVTLRLAYDVNDIDLPQGEFSTRIFRTTVEVAFSSRLFWINLMQYDNVSEIIGLQSRLQWIPKAGQEFFIVANRSLQDLDKDGTFRSLTAEYAVRASYTWRF
ncbi:MAG: carbohydrate binding family 9 domain-containing protein [Pseudomonadota bacterium]